MSKTKKVPVKLIADDADKEGMGEALRRRDNMDYQCFLLLRELMDDYRFEIQKIVAKEETELEEDEPGLVQRCREAIEERTKATNDFLIAASGRKKK